MGKIVRYITTDGSAFVIAGDTTDMVSKAENIHKTSAVTTAALGRLMTAASMMGVMLKGKDDSVTLRLNGGGPAGCSPNLPAGRAFGRVSPWLSGTRPCSAGGGLT